MASLIGNLNLVLLTMRYIGIQGKCENGVAVIRWNGSFDLLETRLISELICSDKFYQITKDDSHSSLSLQLLTCISALSNLDVFVFVKEAVLPEYRQHSFFFPNFHLIGKFWDTSSKKIADHSTVLFCSLFYQQFVKPCN